MKKPNKKELKLIKRVLDLYPIAVIREAAEKKQKLRAAEDNYFGSCSVCGDYDECLNVKRDHHFVCHQHKKRWWIGSNLFSGWRDETEEKWERNAQLLEHYVEISGEEWFERKFEPLNFTEPEPAGSLPF